MPVVPFLPAIFAAGSAVATGISAVSQNKADRKAADVAMATADHNANVDKAQATQLDLNTLENVRTERAQNEIYLSRQAATYANAGVLATSGSALHAQITDAGLMEQRIQQQYVDSQQKQQQLYSQAAITRAEGMAQAEADRAAGRQALFDGGAKIAGTLFAAGMGGAFGSLGSAGSIAPSVAQAGDLSGVSNLSTMQQSIYSPGLY